MRALILVLLLAPSASGQDVDLQTRPEAIYVESMQGSLVPMERVFFHIVIENKSNVPFDIQWLRFDVVNPAGTVFSGQYSGKALQNFFDSAIDRRRIEPTPQGTLSLAAGQRKAISDIFIDLPAGFIGENLMLEVNYKSGGKEAFGRTSTVLRRMPGFSGRLPLDGIWYVAAEHSFEDPHKRFFAEAFAYDFLQIGANGKSFQRDGKNNSDYYAYGKKVLAAKDGTVVFVRGDVAENVAAETTNTAAPGGNVVVIDHGNNQFGYYAHLKPSSVSVRAGNRVRAGDAIGEVGNSGDSSEPHLHFHVMDNPDPSQADGIPVVFESWKAQSYSRSPVERRQRIITRGEFVQP